MKPLTLVFTFSLLTVASLTPMPILKSEIVSLYSGEQSRKQNNRKRTKSRKRFKR